MTGSLLLSCGLAWLIAVGGKRVRRLTPGTVLALTFVAAGVLGALLWESVASQAAVSATLRPVSGRQGAILQVFLVAALGGVTANLFTRTSASVDWRRSDLRLPPRLTLWAVAGGWFLLGVRILGVGPAALIRRTNYLGYTGPPILQKAGGLALILASLLAAICATTSSRRAGRLAGWWLLAACGAVAVGTATRAMALIPLLVMLGLYVRHGFRWKRPARAALLVALSFLLLSVPLALRSRPTHGLLPYVGATISDPGRFVEELPSAAGNLLFSFPLAESVRQEQNFTVDDLTTALDVTPLSNAHWAQRSGLLRLNAFTPYSTLGELSSLGLGVVFFYVAGVAGLLNWAHRRVRSSSPRIVVLLRLVILAGTGLIAVTMLQYNTRAATKLVYALVIGAVIELAVTRLQFRAPRTSPVRRRAPMAPSQVS